MLAEFLRANRAWLIRLNLRLASWLGAPEGMRLSAYSWKLEQEGDKGGIFWRKRIDAFFMAVFNQQDHCKKDYERYVAEQGAKANG